MASERRNMSKYSTQKYIDKKFNDIFMDTNVMKAYNLGLAVGYYQAYRNAKITLGEEKMKEIYSSINGDDYFSKTFRTLIELDSQENSSTAEKFAEVLENNKRPDVKLSDDDRDFLEDFMEFLNQKGR